MIVGLEKPPLGEVLAHHGVKGMRWGVVRKNLAERSAVRAQNKQLNKESKARDTAARDAEIEAARQRYATTARANYLKAKEQYKVDKQTIGSREARKKLDAVKDKNFNDYQIAQQSKSGKETTLAVLGIVGAIALTAIAGAAQRA